MKNFDPVSFYSIDLYEKKFNPKRLDKMIGYPHYPKLILEKEIKFCYNEKHERDCFRYGNNGLRP